jgi:uncharacterized membrane protein
LTLEEAYRIFEIRLITGGAFLSRIKVCILIIGIGVAYFVLFASFAISEIIGFFQALGGLVVVCAISIFAAIRYEYKLLVIIGIIGAFLAPFLLGGFRDSGFNRGDFVLLMVYIIAVDIGILAVAVSRNWRWLSLLALVFSLIYFGFWYTGFKRSLSPVTIEILISLVFLVFVGVTTVFNIIQRHKPVVFDFILLIVNAASYFIISIGVLWGEYRGWMGLYALMSALLYGGLSFLVFRGRTKSSGLGPWLMGIAILLAVPAIIFQIID